MFTPFGLERYFAAHEFSARYLLCTSDCESMHVSELLALGEKEHNADALSRTWLGYTESRGLPLLREKIAKLYAGIRPDEVLVHAGAEEAILNLFMAEIKPGDTVIVNWPCYQSLYEIPRSLGAAVRKWSIRRTSDRWLFDPDDLASLLLAEFERSGSHVKMVVLNTPHNPTGALMTRTELQRIVELCEHYGVLLLVDEVYRLLELHGAERLPAICDIYQNGISLSVLSKSWGLAGLRIGWLASRRTDILDHVAAVKDYNSICASAPSETLACIALDRSSAILERNRSICERNWARFKALFDKYPEFFEYVPPQAGSVAFPSLRNEGLRYWPDAYALAGELLEAVGALLLPGSLYGEEFAQHFRIGLGRISAERGIEAFERWLGMRTERI